MRGVENGAEREALCRGLAQADGALGFLLFFVAALLLSFWGTAVQRGGICLLLNGEEEEAAALPDVAPARRVSAAMVTGALGFFLCLAWDGFQRAGTEATRRTTWANLWAAILAMAAGLLRLWALGETADSRGADSDLPD